MLVSDIANALMQLAFTYWQGYWCFQDIATFGCSVAEASSSLIIEYITMILDVFYTSLVTYSVCFFEYSVVTLTNLSYLTLLCL